MSLRFQADNDLTLAIVKAVRRLEPAVDFASANATGLHGVTDAEILNRAAKDDRVLVSHDVNTMLDHFRRHLSDGKTSPGLLVASKRASVREVAEALVLIWAASDPGELRDQVYHLPSMVRHEFSR